MSYNTRPGLVLEKLGSAGIKNAYDGVDTSSGTASQPFNGGRGGRIRFFVHVFRAGALTSLTLKLQQRFKGNGVTLGWKDLPSHLDDVQGAAQPKGPTFEIEHAFTGINAGDNYFTFYLDRADGTLDLRLESHADAAGQSGDIVRVYASQV